MHPIFDLNFASFRVDQIEAVFEKFNLENLIDDIISNGDFNVFNVHNIMTPKFDAVMENSFGKTLPEDVKIQFIRKYVQYWSDLGCGNSLNSIPDDIQHSKTLNWRYYQHSTITSIHSYSDASRSWISLINRQTLGDASYFFVSNFGSKSMATKFPELVEQYKISPYVKSENIASLSNSTGLTHTQIRNWFENQRKRNGESKLASHASTRHPELLESFERDPFLSKTEMQELLKSTGLSRSALRSWFQEERARKRKMGDDSIKFQSLSIKYPELEKQFEIDPYSRNQYKQLALKTGLSERQVELWFQRKRHSISALKIPNLITKYSKLILQFENNPYPTPNELDILVSTTGLAKIQIQTWFKYQQKKNGIAPQKFDMATKYPQLVEQFELNPHPNREDVDRLIEVTGLSKKQIWRWFKTKQQINGMSGPVFSQPTKSTMRNNYPELKQQFNVNPYPVEDEINKLSEVTNLSNEQLKRWFNKERLRLGITRTKNSTCFENQRIRNKIKNQPIAKTYPQLLESYEQNAFPSKTTMQELAKSTDLPQSKIQKWFQNERSSRRAKGQSILMPVFSNEYPELEAQFEIDPYSTKQHKELAQKTGLSKDQVMNWFNRQRKSARKNGIQVRRYPQLEKQFEKNPQPSESDIHRLIEVTGLSRKQIYGWFRRQQKLNNLDLKSWKDVSSCLGPKS